MPDLGTHNFLSQIKQLITGGAGSTQLYNLPADTSGFFLDMQQSPYSISLGASTVTYTTDADGFPILQATGLNNPGLSTSTASGVVGSNSFIIPRDYDAGEDYLRLRVFANMAASTNTPVMTASTTIYFPGEVISTYAASTGSTASASAVLGSTLSPQVQAVEFNLSGKGLVRDSIVNVILSTGAHSTDNVQIYGTEWVYASCLVAYSSPLANSTTNDNFGNPLRGY
jgi:hypothetical protein